MIEWRNGCCVGASKSFIIKQGHGGPILLTLFCFLLTFHIQVGDSDSSYELNHFSVGQIERALDKLLT